MFVLNFTLCKQVHICLKNVHLETSEFINLSITIEINVFVYMTLVPVDANATQNKNAKALKVHSVVLLIQLRSCTF